MSLSLIWPRPLKPGGTVGICSPASSSPPPALVSGVRALQKRGYRVVLSPRAAATSADFSYLAGTDQERAGDLSGLLADGSVDAIICARGGYGAGRILDLIDYDLLRRDPKPVVGYSDITALNLGFAARAGVVSFSGIMATTRHDLGGAELDPASEFSLWQALGDNPFPRVFAHPDGLPAWERHGASGTATGPVYAACLSLLTSLLGTPYVPDLTGAILVIEDVGEDLYRIDRMLTQLRLAGVLENLAALVLGAFNGKGDEEDLRLAVKVPALARALTPPHVPVASGIAYGHIARRLTIPCGAVGTVDFAAETLTFKNTGG